MGVDVPYLERILLVCLKEPLSPSPLLPQTLADQPQASVDKFLLPMPKWPERESTLLRQLQKREGVDEDAAALQVKRGRALGGRTRIPTVLTHCMS